MSRLPSVLVTDAAASVIPRHCPCFQEGEGEDRLLFLPGERVGGRPSGGQRWEGPAAGVEEADPAVQQSQSGHGGGHPGSVSIAAAAAAGLNTTA